MVDFIESAAMVTLLQSLSILLVLSGAYLYFDKIADMVRNNGKKREADAKAT